MNNMRTLNDPRDAEIERLKAEVDMLRKVNTLQAEQISTTTTTMDEMLGEVERRQRDFARSAENMQTLSSFINRVTNAMDDALIFAGPDGRIRQVNRRLHQDLGYDPDELIGRSLDVIFCDREIETLAKSLPEFDRKVTSYVYEGICVNSHLSLEAHLLPKAGYNDCTYYLCRGSVLYAPNGKIDGVVVVASDIAALKAREHSLIKAQEAASKATQAKSEFLAHMSHELRTPLNAIIGFTDTILMEVFGPLGNDKYREYLTHVKDAGGHLLLIINDILDLSKVEAGQMKLQMEKVNIAHVVDTVETMVMDRARQGRVKVTSLLETDLPDIRGDNVRINQILLNLVSNAVKFTPEGGRVTLSASTEGSWIVFEVEDTGIGLSEEQLERVVQPFVQADHTAVLSHEGTGLGLPLSIKLIELHGGTFDIESELSKGTRIRVKLPAQTSKAFQGSVGFDANSLLPNPAAAISPHCPTPEDCPKNCAAARVKAV